MSGRAPDYQDGMKRCNDCARWLRLDQYHKRKRGGRIAPQPYCAECMRARWHKWNKTMRAESVVYRPVDPLACMGPVAGTLRGSL